MRNMANQQGRRIINGAEEVDGRFQVDVLDLLNVAIQQAKKYVIMKWPQHLSELKKPLRTVSGKTIRYDIYSGIFSVHDQK